jgi:hypothetical protein
MALNNLAILYIQQGKLRQAKPLCDKALATLEGKFSREHPKVREVLDTIAQLQYRSEAGAEVAGLQR